MNEPWVRHEDEHLLAVAKPAGVTTHRADEHAQDGMYEWVQRQRPAVQLSVLHRLDKGTSGILVFGRSTEANRSLTAQLTERTVTKRYDLLVERDGRRPAARSCQVPVDGAEAATDFERVATGDAFERHEARPHSGRTHQVRVHATALGMPVLGDDAHHGVAAARLFLHAAGFALDHPTGGPLELTADRPPSFDRALAAGSPEALVEPVLLATVAHEARAALFDPEVTNAYVWADRHHDGFPHTRIERLGEVALVVTYGDEPERTVPASWLDALHATLPLRAIYHQHRPRGGGAELPRLVSGSAADRFEVIELGARYVVDLQASTTSSGLFLDQRDTRHHLLSAELAGRTVLNAFAHTGSLSVAAAQAGAETLTLDLSRHYLDWAAENLRANGLEPADHDFVYGDAMEWLERFAKKGRTFDVVLVDPPSSSTPRKRGGRRWVVDRDLHDLVTRSARLVAPGGLLFVSTNLRRMAWSTFLEQVEHGLAGAQRTGSIDTRTLPLDHRSGPGDPPYLKAAWIRLTD